MAAYDIIDKHGGPSVEDDRDVNVARREDHIAVRGRRTNRVQTLPISPCQIFDGSTLTAPHGVGGRAFEAGRTGLSRTASDEDDVSSYVHVLALG